MVDVFFLKKGSQIYMICLVVACASPAELWHFLLDLCIELYLETF